MRTLSPRRTDQEWMDLIVACRTSGLSDRAWCREHGIPSTTFYYHIKQLREKACDIPDSDTEDMPQKQEVVPIDFQEFNVCESERTTSSGYTGDVAVIVDYHGISMRVVNGAAGSAILETLKALRELC